MLCSQRCLPRFLRCRCGYSGWIGRSKSHVIISDSHSIFDNLALEDWLYENVDFSLGQKILLLWRNRPCVVIGKFQNQWLECNHMLMREKSIPLVRRKSGGGAVYHDMGNINLSFLTHRDEHSRSENLSFICDSLMSRWPHLDLTSNNRHDILLNKRFKVSGTAAKMTRTKAYHHCTLLVNSDSETLSKSLRSPIKELVKSNASASLPSPVAMLNSVNHPLSSEQVLPALAEDYLSKFTFSSEQTQMSVVRAEDINEATYPGIEDIKGELTSWQWLYGKTPKFTISQPTTDQHQLCVSVERGVIQHITLRSADEGLDRTILSSLNGLPFCPLTLPLLVSQHKHLSTDPHCTELLHLFDIIKNGL